MKRRTFLQTSSLALGTPLKFLAGAVVPAALLAPGAFAQEEEEAERVRNFLEVEHALPLDFITPHTEWAKPYAGGQISAVFFTLWFEGSTYAREIIELLERFDLKAQAVYYMQGARLVGDGRPDWYGGDPQAGTKRALRLLDEPNDVLFFNQLRLEVLEQDIRDRIHQKVAQGAGLVMVGDKLNPPFEDAQAVTAPPALPAGSRCFTVGKGRVALLPSREKLQFRLGWETEFDYQMQSQGRALLWAARREPAAGLNVRVPQQSVSRATLPARTATLSWSGMPAGAKVKPILRRWDGEKLNLRTVKAAGTGSAEVILPRVREGRYHLDVFAVSGRGTVNWATTELRIDSTRHVEAVALDKNWSELGGKVTGQARLAGKPEQHERVNVRLVDRRGRILAKQEFPASTGTVPFAFEIEPWTPMLLRVEAALVEGNDEVSSAHAYLRVTRRHRGRFNFVMWGSPSGDLAPYGVESFARHGVTMILQGGDPPLCFSQYDLSYIPYSTGFRASSHTLTAMLDPKTGYLKSGCVYDQEKMQEAIRRSVDYLRRARQQGVFAYSLGDENAVRGSCLSPYCLRAYQEYLKKAYGDIASLNREWNTEYRAFEDIQLLTAGELPSPDAPKWFKEYYAERQQLQRSDDEAAKGPDNEKQLVFGDINDEMRALQAGNYARWYDRQAFQNHTYVHWCRQYQKAYKGLDPQAWTGFEGTDDFAIRRLTTRSRQGGDLDAFIREMDYFAPYHDPSNEVIRSIARPGLATGNWTGYDPDAETLLGDYWAQVTDGLNTPQWWRWDNLSGYHGFLAPSLVPFPATQELLDDTQVVRDGLGRLLMECSIHDDGVAMLYSMPSTYIAHFDGNETYGDYKRDHAVWHELLHNAGLQFRYVTDRMMRRGEFDAARFRVLLLPLAFAMTPQEAEVIRNFVRNGGTVIADVRPATYDGHCKPLEQGLLDDVFGIRRTGKRDAMAIDRLNVDGNLNRHALRMQWGNWHGHDVYPQMKVDPAVELTTGKGLGQAFWIHYWAGLNSPVCVVNEFGKGRAVLLNFSIFQAPADRLITGLLASAGVQPAIRVTTPEGAPVKGVEVTRWSNGRIELLALFGSYKGAVKARLPEPRLVSDLKNQTEVRRTSEFTVTLRPNRAAFFALLPAPPSPPEVILPAGSAQRGAVVQARVAVPDAAGKHPVMIRAVNPAGEEAEWLAETVMAGQEPAALTLPFAHNDPPGVWQIQATDLLGKGTATVKLELR